MTRWCLTVVWFITMLLLAILWIWGLSDNTSIWRKGDWIIPVLFGLAMVGLDAYFYVCVLSYAMQGEEEEVKRKTIEEEMPQFQQPS